MKRAYEDYLRDMLDNSRLALDFAQGMEYDKFFEDEKSSYAVMRALEIVGEAARQIPDEVREAHPEIPWREMTGPRAPSASGRLTSKTKLKPSGDWTGALQSEA